MGENNMQTYLFSDCSGFFSACQIGIKIRQKQFYINEIFTRDEVKNKQQYTEVDNCLGPCQIQHDLLRLEIAAAMVCHAMRIRYTNLSNYDEVLGYPPEFFASYYHNVLGIDVDWHVLSETADWETIHSLQKIWHNITSHPTEYYESELQPIFNRYEYLLTQTEQLDLQNGLRTNFGDLNDDGLHYRYSLLCKAAEGITVRKLHGQFERHGYQGIINDLNNIRKKPNEICGKGHKDGFNTKRSICIAQVIYSKKSKWFCSVSGLWDRSELGAPWTETHKHMPQPFFPQTTYDKCLEKQLDSIIKKLPNTTKWCKTSKNVESYFDNKQIAPLSQPITLLDTLRKIFIQGYQIKDWKRLFSCGERKILCKLTPQLNDIQTINFFVDREPCSICSYSIDQMNKLEIDIELFYIC